VTRKSPAILVLTATVTPPVGVPNLKRTSPLLRWRDYIEALEFYLNLPTKLVDRIVFLENSGADLSDLRDLSERKGRGKRVEFISFQGLDYPPAYGRAYGEFKMLDYGFQHSALLQALKDEEFFWKITGRLRVLNIGAVIQTAPATYQMLIDFHRWPTQMVDWRLMSCSRLGYRRLYEGLYPTLREDALKMACEAYCYLIWKERTKELGIVPRHRRQPKIRGVGGQHNIEYYGGPNVAKYWIRVMARHLAPQLWI